MIEFIGPLYSWLQQCTNHYLTHCHFLPTGHSTEIILTSNWTELNWHILLASPYIVLGRTTAQKTHPLPSSGYMRTHIKNTSCDTGSIVVFTTPLHNNGDYLIVEWVHSIVDCVLLWACLLRRSFTIGLQVTLFHSVSHIIYFEFFIETSRTSTSHSCKADDIRNDIYRY
jgi:hypothetical protein